VVVLVFSKEESSKRQRSMEVRFGLRLLRPVLLFCIGLCSAVLLLGGRSAHSQVFDDQLQSDVFNSLCTPPESGGERKRASSIPFFCKTLSDNFTANAELFDDGLTRGNFVVDVSNSGNSGELVWYPTPENGTSEGGCNESTPANETVEFCTLEGLVIIPTGNFQARSRLQREAKGTVPMASVAASASFLQSLTSGYHTGESPFQQGLSLATSSCGPKCGAGYQCTPALQIALAIDSLGVCEPCEIGGFCPEGTIHDGGLFLGTASLNGCPQGFFCPDPTEAYNCPAGWFCPPGSHKPFSCDDIAISELELQGNYCPENSFSPFGLCPKGYYCPTSEEAIVCPAGYYCAIQSIEPKPCPALSACPEKTSKPNISWISLIAISSLFGGFAIVLLVVSFWIKASQRGVLRQAKQSAKFASLIKAIGVKLGLSSDQMSYASNLKGFTENIMLVDILVRNLYLRVANRGKSKVVLRDVNITFRASTLNIILGSSGAGKTTFLKALVGKFSENAYPSGEIKFEFKNQPLKVNLISGKNTFLCSRSLAKLRARETAVSLGAGYVAQDNIVHEILTVHENIAYSARLRLGSQMSAATKNSIIQDTITILGLNHIQNAQVGNPLSVGGSISGGEARRVSIGLELVACPGLLILDEPTSGLDAVAANDVMSSLNKMSDLGVTVVASLHQPRYSTFLLFDSVHLFMKGGYVIYSGPTSNALPYFTSIGFRLPSRENPSDFMMDVISGLIELPGNRDFSPKDLVKLWQEESLGALSSRSQRISSRKFPFDVTSEDLWQSKDDACLSSRSQPFARSDNTLHNLITSTKSKDLLEQEDSGGVLELKRMATPRWLETLGEQFDRLDSKREGFIDSGDMMDLLQSMGQRCTIHEANEIVKHFDIDGDGKIMRKDFLLRWTKNYWTREFSTALLGLFPEESCLEIDSLSRESLSPTFRRKLSANFNDQFESAIEMNDLQKNYSTSSQKHLLSRKSTRESSKTDVLELFTSRNVLLRSAGGFFGQLFLLLQREPLKMMRTLELRVLDFGSVAVIGLGYAFVNRGTVSTNLESVRQATSVAMLFVGVLSALWATIFISRELPMVQREASQGVSVSAIFISLNLFNTAVDLVIRSLAYALPYYYICGFSMAFQDFFLVTFGSAWCTSGIGILTSCLTNSKSAIVLAVAITFLFGAVLNGVTPTIRELQEHENPLLYWMVFPSYNRWATEALTVREEGANPMYNFVEKVESNIFSYHPDNWANGILFLYISGIVLRFVSFGFFYRKALQ
jgi:ABC-type multidrug transport system ATPase subunit